MSTYLPKDGSGGSPYQEGGGLYALGKFFEDLRPELRLDVLWKIQNLSTGGFKEVGIFLERLKVV